MTTHASAFQPSSGSTPHQLLLRVSKANKKTLGLFAEGINLHNATARPLIDLQHQACADRIALAKKFLITADRLMRTRPREYRSAISRYYYAMYHAIRAVAYFNEGGDDKESHSTLPGAVQLISLTALYGKTPLRTRAPEGTKQIMTHILTTPQPGALLP